MADKSSKKKTGLTLACIILAILVIFIFFLVQKDSILTNLKETRFFERVFGKTPEFVENHTPSETETVKIPLTQSDEVVIKVEPSKNQTQKSEKASSDSTTKQEEKSEDTKAASQEKPQKEKTEKDNSKPVQNAYTELQICFVEIDSDGSISRKIIKRSVPKTDSPLTTAIKEVLSGPKTTNAEERNCISLIPAGTKLLGARVSDGVAYLDFSENFEINTYGIEGYNGQLMQLVYTATSFATVNSVQFLIEGQKKEYLGSEGQWIGSPLSRNSF